MPDLSDVADDIPTRVPRGVLQVTTDGEEYEHQFPLDTNFSATPPPEGSMFKFASGAVVDRTPTQVRSDIGVYEGNLSAAITTGDTATFDSSSRLTPTTTTPTDFSSSYQTAGRLYRGNGSAISDVDTTAATIRALPSVTNGTIEAGGTGRDGDIAIVQDGNGWYWAKKGLVTANTWTDIGPAQNPCRMKAHVDANVSLTPSLALVTWFATPDNGSNGWTYDAANKEWVCPQAGTYRVVCCLNASLSTTGRESVSIFGYYKTNAAATEAAWSGNFKASCTVGDDTTVTDGRNQVYIESEVVLEATGRVHIKALGSHATNCLIVGGAGFGLLSIQRIR